MTSLRPMAISFHSKFLNANSAFAVLSLVMLVFLQQFQKLGRAKSLAILQRVMANP